MYNRVHTHRYGSEDERALQIVVHHGHVHVGHVRGSFDSAR